MKVLVFLPEAQQTMGERTENEKQTIYIHPERESEEKSHNKRSAFADKMYTPRCTHSDALIQTYSLDSFSRRME